MTTATEHHIHILNMNTFTNSIKAGIHEMNEESVRIGRSFVNLLRNWLDENIEVEYSRVTEVEDCVEVSVKPLIIDEIICLTVKKKIVSDWKVMGF
jgi:hypothetical protein